jgi:dipeptidyl aminopeptidase/acylaminoacyl peptidase
VPAAISREAIARSHALADPRWSPDGTRLAWVDSFDGRSDVVVAPADGSGPPIVVTAETSIDGGYCWAGSDEIVVASADGPLFVVHADGGIVRRLTSDGRALAPAVSSRSEVACSIERDDACDVTVVPLDGASWPERVSRADYAWDANWSPDGRELCWHEWDLPDMPWDSSRIVVSARDDSASSPRVVAEGACGQPRFSPEGSALAFVRDGLLCVDGALVLDESIEQAEPSWSPGQRSFAWSPDSAELVWCQNERGFGRLMVGAPGRRSARELSKGWHRGIEWSAHGIACARSGAVTPSQIVLLAANGSSRETIARGPVGGFDRVGLVEPRAVTWKSGNATVHGLLWRPPDAASRPPLLVNVHGGPTGQALADWNPRVQRYVNRGWAVLQPNHRGSTGYGVPYRRALEGHWGDREVADVAAGIRHAVKEGWGDGARVAVMGGSAGGFTALLVAALHPELVSAVVALYPVTDLLDLHATTHRFESGYNLRLVGPLPEAIDQYRSRSPIALASRMRAPTLLLHGAADRSVRPEQSEQLEHALRRAGVWVERHVYDREGHGWRRAETVADELTRVDAFLQRWLA